MSAWRTNVWLRLRALMHRRAFDRDLEDEIGFHLAMRERTQQKLGLTPDDARHAARRQFGNVALLKEDTREMWTFVMLETLWQDACFAARTLRKSPAFLAVVVLSLALGIGANSTIFSVLNTVLYRPLPYRQPDRLEVVWETELSRPNSQESPAIADGADWRKQTHVFEDIALTSFTEVTPMAGDGGGEQARAQYVTPNFFHLMGVSPMFGRVFTASEAQDLSQTVVVSDAFWKRRFNRDPKVLGKTFKVSGVVSTVVGVMPPTFGSFYGGPLDMWVPIDADSARYSERKDHWLIAIGRLRPGATQSQAQIEMGAIAHRLEQAWPATNKGVGAKVQPFHDALYGGMGRNLYPLMGAVVCVLLIACVNAANLLQARTETRRTEFAVRASLGAGRRRLMRQLLVESGLLGLAGGALGIGLTFAGIRLFRAIAIDFPEAERLSVDIRVLLFTLAASLATAILVGSAPAFQAARADLNLALRAGERRTTAGVAGRRTRHILAISEIALAMVLLVGAGLTLDSLFRLQHVDTGFDPANVMNFDLSVPEGAPYVERLAGGDIERVSPLVAAFYRRLLDKVSAIPGVESVGTISPFDFGGSFSVLGRPAPPADKMPSTSYRVISPAFFRTLRIPLKTGRYLNGSDLPGAPWTAVVDESFARRFFPNEDPIGKRMRLRYSDMDEKQPRQIVGVVGDVKWYLADKGPTPVVYASYLQQGSDFRGGNSMTILAQTLVVRSASGLGPHAAGLVAAVKKAVAELEPDQPVFGIETMEQALARTIGDSRLFARLLEIFALIALLLAAIGIYGSMSYFVTERTHEIGIRVALGAQRGSILGLVARLGLKLSLTGVAIGATLALGLTRVIAQLLFGVTPTDPVTFAAVGLGLLSIALLACYIPARRATRVDPMVALRHE
ncbi:MAG TPA: ABC transporter permease [Bryobacteraceae bacterium]|nr:ABC transporter permease [Bryobacteraceae bacterium]